MEKTCGNCGWVTSVELSCHFAAGDGRYYGRFTRPDAKPCEHWTEATDTLEQRYQQLAEVARELYKAVEPMHESCNEDTCLALIDEGWPSDACLYDFRKRLEELGVEL